jgi:tetratricopeptide (TPR) repeat protein
LSLTKKQKGWIYKNKKKSSPKEMSEELNAAEQEIINYLNSIKKNQQPKIFYLFLILIPVLFFVLLEIGLRIFNYGYDFIQWVEVTDKKLMLNPDIAHKYFYNTQNVPNSNQDLFDKIKAPNSFRAFILGGSSGAGYPFSPNGSFTRYLQDRLQLVYPDSKIEVVNCSMTAINSYSLRDFLPGILEQKPDLILIYAGHNEYYGALGVGSLESFGTSRALVNMVIKFEEFKTFQLIRNSLSSIVKIFSSKKTNSGTLMSRMAQNQNIEYNSGVYKKGLSQFEGNLDDILQMAKDKNVPVILGTLTCNLKDQPPFISLKSNVYPSADKIFNEAKQELSTNNFVKADSNFRFAKDLDALRFRAPSAINKIIYKLAKKYNDNVLNIDSAFAAISPDHIVGNNLMTDHLHPTLFGYKFMGRLFFDEMKKLNYLPKTQSLNLSEKLQDSITVSNFNFSRLDSVIGEYRIKLLKNDWPFVNAGKKLSNSNIINPKNRIDSIAANYLEDKFIWEQAHRKAAAYYLERKNINSFLREMDVLIEEYPIITEYYEYVANTLIPLKEWDKTYKYLVEEQKIKPTAFATKWIGTIELYKGHLDSANVFLNESLKFDDKDPQVWYNLSGVYVNKEDYKKALEMISKALELKPDYPEALSLKEQLKNATK